MKKLVLNLICLLFLSSAFAQSAHSVNAVIGDESFTETHLEQPNAATDELLRLQTHLSYVEQLLRGKDVSHLSNSQKENRAIVLQLLHEYWTNGIFPKNYDYEGRRPCFIDRHGNICAVGYLIEKTAGRQTAEMINEKHQYDYLLDMNEQIIADWAIEHGLTLEECAMIQPMYQYVPPETYNVPVKSSYGISSAALTGVNVGVNVISLSRFAGRSKIITYLGLVTGTSQIVLGLANIKKEEQELRINSPSRTISYKQQNAVSYVNIASGTTTILTSAFNLLINKHIKDKRNAVSIYSYPNAGNSLTTGLTFTRSL
jgi:hypothetical protein